MCRRHSERNRDLSPVDKLLLFARLAERLKNGDECCPPHRPATKRNFCGHRRKSRHRTAKLYVVRANSHAVITFLGSVTSIKDALVGSLHRTVTFIGNFRVADCSVPSVRCGPWFDRFRHVTQEQNVLPPESFSNVGAEVDGLSSSSTLKASDYACKQQYC